MSCLADIDTLPAKHAPVGMVVQDGVVLNDRYLLEESIQPFGLKAHLQEPGDSLELTSSIGRTGPAVHLMDGHEEPEGAPLKTPHGRGIGLDGHVFRDSHGAGRARLFLSFYLNKAQPAGGGRGRHLFEVTEIGNVDVILKAYLKEARPFLSFNFPPIYRNPDRHKTSLLLPLRPFYDRGETRWRDPSNGMV